MSDNKNNNGNEATTANGAGSGRKVDMSKYDWYTNGPEQQEKEYLEDLERAKNPYQGSVEPFIINIVPTKTTQVKLMLRVLSEYLDPKPWLAPTKKPESKPVRVNNTNNLMAALRMDRMIEITEAKEIASVETDKPADTDGPIKADDLIEADKVAKQERFVL